MDVRAWKEEGQGRREGEKNKRGGGERAIKREMKYHRNYTLVLEYR